MTSGNLRERYEAAVWHAAPNLAMAPSGLLPRGLWFSDAEFHFVADDGRLGGDLLAPAARVADVERRSIQHALGPEDIRSLMSEAGIAVTEEALLGASMTWLSPETIGLEIAGYDARFDVKRGALTGLRPALAQPACFSPDGQVAIVVSDHDLALVTLRTGARRALTGDGRPGFAYGQESQTSGSVVSYRARPRPLGLWSPDSRWFITHRIDEQALPEVTLVQAAPPGGHAPAFHSHRFATPSDPLPIAELFAFDASSGAVIHFADLCFPITSFSPFSAGRVWFGTRDEAWIVVLDRYWRRAELHRLDLSTRESRLVMSEETDRGHLDLHPLIIGRPNIRTLDRTAELIWWSEREGRGRLYLHDRTTGGRLNAITPADWIVRDIVQVDENRRRVSFLASALDGDPARRMLCSASLSGGDARILLADEGDVYCPPSDQSRFEQDRPFQARGGCSGLSPNGRIAAVRLGRLDENLGALVSLGDGRRLVLARAGGDIEDVACVRICVTAADGDTPLYGVLFHPRGPAPDQTRPLVDYIYPGPQLAHAPQSFRAMNASPALSLASLGFVVLMLDTRGTPGRHRDFHQGGYGELLEPQLSDHAAAVRELCRRFAFIDPDRIGIIGQSGGGAAAARAMFDYGDLFQVGVSVCGNHDSSVYAATWSDKYRGPPRDDWQAQSNIARAWKLAGRLLLVTGDMDENVSCTQTLRLADALLRADKDFGLLIVPNAGHGVMMTSGYAMRRIWDFFLRAFGAEGLRDFASPQFDGLQLERFARRYLQEVLE